VSRPIPAEVTVDGRSHPVMGAQLAVVRDGRVLLQLRPWPPGWELPGGHCEAGEDPAATALREAEEETGLRVALGGLVGVYSWSGLRRVGDAVYWGTVTGGRPRRSIESLRIRFVSPSELPATVFPWVRDRAADALAVVDGGPPVHRVQPVHPRHVLFFGLRWLATAVDRARSLRRRLRRS
jgi:8-oxo-dGTP pyrophosphatase MutT (NUDIX family)